MLYDSIMAKDRKQTKVRMGRPPLPAEKRKKSLPIMFDPTQLMEIELIAEAEAVTKGEAVRLLIDEALSARRVKRRRKA